MYATPSPLPPPPLPALEMPAAPGARPLRTRGAIWTLAFLSPVTAEVLTGSTPILLFLIPFAIGYQVLFYGSGALLIREVARRRGLGWGNIVMLGAAYSILEEGLVNTTWFNPYWPDVLTYHRYGMALGLNWVWALGLIAFHAIISITIPIFLAEQLFPQRAARPWLGRGGIIGFGAALTLTSLLGFWLFGFVLDRGPGYSAPPLIPYLGTLALAVLLVAVGVRRWPTSTRVVAPRQPPRLWWLRVIGFLAMAFEIVNVGIFQTLVPAWAAFVVNVLVYGGLLLLVTRWGRNPRWGARHALALSYGALGLFIFLTAPILEVVGSVNGKPTHGTAAIALGYAIMLTVLSRRAKRGAHWSHPTQIC